MTDKDVMIIGALAIMFVLALGTCLYIILENRHLSRLHRDARDLDRIDML